MLHRGRFRQIFDPMEKLSMTHIDPNETAGLVECGHLTAKLTVYLISLSISIFEGIGPKNAFW